MVGVGPNGSESSLARVSLVDWNGAVVLDEFVRQKERVTDWRTQWSGIREKDMTHGVFLLYSAPVFCSVWRRPVATATSFEEVQAKVADIIKDRILIGHAIHNDLKVCPFLHGCRLYHFAH